jgi:hypothetical protein
MLNRVKAVAQGPGSRRGMTASRARAATHRRQAGWSVAAPAAAPAPLPATKKMAPMYRDMAAPPANTPRGPVMKSEADEVEGEGEGGLGAAAAACPRCLGGGRGAAGPPAAAERDRPAGRARPVAVAAAGAAAL